MSTPIPWGGELLVNTTTVADQFLPTVSALTNGRFVVAWTDWSGTGGDTLQAAVRAQVFNADGTRAGAELLVNTYAFDIQRLPTIAGLADGSFVVAWEDQGAYDFDLSGISARRFAADGTEPGGQFVINGTLTGNQFDPAIAGFADGGFVAAWVDLSETGDDTSGAAIRVRAFDANGTAAVAEFVVNTAVTGDQLDPAIAVLADGRFVVVWQDASATGGDTSGTAIRAQVLNADGSRSGTEILVNATVTGGQFDPAVTALADGRFVVAWQDTSLSGGDDSGHAVRAQVFNADGTASGVEFVVCTTLTGDQRDPAIAALADGRFVVAWTDASQSGGDTSGWAIRAQVFNADGTTSGGEFLVNSTTAGGQSEPAVAALADGRFVVAWQDTSLSGGDDSGHAVRAQIFDPRTEAALVVGTLDDDDFVGTPFADTLWGGLGNDRLDGRGGADELRGGEGNDVYVVDRATDRVVEAAGEGTDQVLSTVATLDLGAYANVENASLLGLGALSLNGNVLGNRLVGNSRDNVLNGSAGNDTLAGNAGNDLLDGGSGNDLLNGGTGSNELRGGAGTDVLQGGAVRDALYGGDGNDRLSGGLGNDVLHGGLGSDAFRFDTLPSAKTNRDTIVDFDAAADTIQLENAVFSTLPAVGTLAAASFTSVANGGATATVGATVKVIYDRGTGNLYYDSDSYTATGRVWLATLSGSPDNVTNADFLVT